MLHPSQGLNVNVLILIVYSERGWTFCLLLLAGHFSACYLFTFCPLLCACCPLLFARYCLLVNFFSLSFVRYFFKLVFARYYLFIAPSFLTILRCNYSTYKFYTYKFWQISTWMARNNRMTRNDFLFIHCALSIKICSFTQIFCIFCILKVGERYSFLV